MAKRRIEREPVSEAQPGYVDDDSRKIVDFVSGQLVRDTPEERESVQVYSRILVEDYDYPKANLQTHPQFRVKSRPSDTEKKYPVDIAVFPNSTHQDGEEYIIVECKKRNRKDGKSQLEDYLRFSKARLGVWFNGEEKLYVQKVERDNCFSIVEIPNIPKFGQRVEDVGHFKRKDLRKAHNLKTTFRSIRNYLAANNVGGTLDHEFAPQIINLIFCKIYDERFTRPDDMVRFRAGIGESADDIETRIKSLFLQVKTKYSDVIDQSDEIRLSQNSIVFIVGELQQYCLVDSERDAIADAFETFIGPSLRGGQGQFFTPRNVVKLVIDFVNPSASDKIIDPACGSGGFLVEALRYVWGKIEQTGGENGWPLDETKAEKQEAAIKNFRGIDKEGFLSKVAKSYMAVLGDGRGGIFCENSLESPSEWKPMAREQIPFGAFDVVVTNPPFGSKLKIDDTTILTQFKLGHRWQKSTNDNFVVTSELFESQTPQVLFIERCLQLLKDNGRMGIIAPESMFCNPSHQYIMGFLKDRVRIRAIISLPEELFQPHTHAKTCVVVLEKTEQPDDEYDIFMAIAEWCGHDSRGLEIPRDDIPKIQAKWDQFVSNGSVPYDRFGFVVKKSQIKNNVYLPKYYNPELPEKLSSISQSHRLVSIQELVEEGLIEIATGDEVGKLAYGTGNIPFIRSSDIASWELKIDAKQGLSQEIYDSYKVKQDVRENDILMVRDGTYLVGTCALVTKNDKKIVYQSHIFKIRSMDHDRLSPYLLLALLSSPVVKEQIRSKQFTQDIIDTLGRRISELVLPIPKSSEARLEIISQVKEVIDLRVKARSVYKKTILGITPIHDFDEEEEFLTLR